MIVDIRHIMMPGLQITVGHYLPEAFALGKNERERRAVAELVKDACGPAARLAHHDSGAPYIVGVDSPPAISVSHCATAAAIVTGTEGALGIDIEQQRPQLQRVKDKYLTPVQQAIFHTPQLQLMAWTAKEAVYKAALTPGLELLDIALTPGGAILGGVAYRSYASARGRDYILTHLSLDPDIMLTVAVE